MDNWTLFWICLVLILLLSGFLLRLFDLFRKRNNKRRYKSYHKRNNNKHVKKIQIGRLSDYIVEQGEEDGYRCVRCDGPSKYEGLCSHCRKDGEIL